MKKSIVFAGSFDRNNPAYGIQTFLYDEHMHLERMSRCGSFQNMSNIVVDGNILVACSEGGDTDVIASYKVLQNAELEELCAIHTGCSLLAHLCIIPEYKFVIASSMGAGAVMLLKYDEQGGLKMLDKLVFPDKGSFDEMQSSNPRQKGSRIHSAFIMPDRKHVQVCNFGSDKIYTLKLHTTGCKLELLNELTYQCDRESGPRHISYSTDGRYAYCNTELTNMIYVFRLNEDCSMELIQTVSALDPAGEQNSQTSISMVSADGRFYFCGNRAQNNIVRFTIGPDGMLNDPAYYDCGGDSPRGIAFGPGGSCIICSNNKSGTLSVLDYNSETGEIGECLQSLTGVPGAANTVWMMPDFAV